MSAGCSLSPRRGRIRSQRQTSRSPPNDARFRLNPNTPGRADPVMGGVCRREAAGNDPVYEIAHLPFDRAARLRFHIVPGCRGRVVFSAKTMSGLFLLVSRPGPKNSPRQNPNENRVFVPPLLLTRPRRLVINSHAATG